MEYEKEQLDVQRLGDQITDAFHSMGEIPEFKLGFGSLVQRQTGAFRHILHRMQAVRENNVAFLSPKTKLLIQYRYRADPVFVSGDTIIEYKNCIIRAISLSELQLLAGSAENLFVDCQCEEEGDGIIKVNMLQRQLAGSVGKMKTAGGNCGANKESPSLYKPPLSSVRRTGNLPRSVSLLFAGGSGSLLPARSEKKRESGEFPKGQHVLLPLPKSQEPSDLRSARVLATRKLRGKTITRALSPTECRPLPPIAKRVFSPARTLQINVENAKKATLQNFFGENPSLSK